jgi:hypothetical protein
MKQWRLPNEVLLKRNILGATRLPEASKKKNK